MKKCPGDIAKDRACYELGQGWHGSGAAQGGNCSHVFIEYVFEQFPNVNPESNLIQSLPTPSPMWHQPRL